MGVVSTSCRTAVIPSQFLVRLDPYSHSSKSLSNRSCHVDHIALHAPNAAGRSDKELAADKAFCAFVSALHERPPLISADDE
jgi:hypothetical protein